MSIQVSNCHHVRCDTCKKDVENGDGFTFHYPDEGLAEEDAQNADWTVWNGHHWCDSCGAPNCTCSHMFGEHDYGEAECQEEDCDCKQFILEN